MERPASSHRRSAFEASVREAWPELETIVARQRIPSADGERIIQTAILTALWNGAGSEVNPRSNPRWLVRMVTLECRRFRKARRRKELAAFDEGLTGMLEASAPELRDYVERLILSMGEECRQSLLARYGFRAERVAAIGIEGVRRCVGAFRALVSRDCDDLA